MPSYKDLNKTYQGGDLRVDGLDSLEGCPQHITGNFDCGSNILEILVGGPTNVDGEYICNSCKLTDLIGCASHIGGILNFCNNDITSLVGIHKIIKSCPDIRFYPSEIKEGGIGLLLIKNLNQITWESEPFYIIEKYLGSGTKGIMECSKELKAKGYADYAKL